MSGVYDVFVKISMTNGVSPGLAIISKEVLGLGTSVKDLTKAFNNMSAGAKAALGGAMIAGAAGLMEVLKGVADHGDELLDQQDKLRRAGVAQNEILKLQAQYYNKIATAVPTSTVAGYLKTVNELRSVVGADQATEIAPWSMKLEAIISNATGKSAEGEGFKLWRALEMTGKTISNPELVSKMAEAFARDIIGSGGKLDANTYQMMAKRGGVAWANAKPEFLAGPMSVAAADMGGDAAGTAMMSGYMFLTGANTLSKQQYEAMDRLHLIDPKKVKWDNAGHANVGPGGIIGSDKYTGDGKFDLYGWAKNVLEPALQKGSKGDRMIADSLIAKVGRNRSVMRLLNMFTDGSFGEQISKDQTQWGQAKGVDAAYAGLVTDDSKGVKEAFDKQYNSMMQSIGAPMMQAALPVMKGVESMFTAIGSSANSNPGAIKTIAEGLVALSGAMGAAGAVRLIAALGPAGWITGGVIAIGAAFEIAYEKSKPLFAMMAIGGGILGASFAWATYSFHLLADNLKYIEPYISAAGKAFDAMGNVLSKLFSAEKLSAVGQSLSTLASALGDKFIAAIKSIPGMVADAITGLGASIAGAIGSELAKIPGMIGGALGLTGATGATPGKGVGSGVHPGTHSAPPATAAPGKQSSLTIINNNIVDGKVVAQSVVKHVVNGAMFPTRTPQADGFTQPSYG